MTMLHAIRATAAVPRAVAIDQGGPPRQRVAPQGTPLQPRLSVRVDDDSGQVVITVIDRDTGQVIRRVPWDEESRLAHRFQGLKGVLLDNTA